MMEKYLPEGWSRCKLGDILSLEYGKSLPGTVRSGEGYPVMGSNGEVGRHSDFLVEGPGIVVGRKGSHGEVVWVQENFFPIDTTYFVKPTKAIETRFAFNLLKFYDLKSLNRSTAVPGLNRTDAYNIDVALPPLAEQKRIVAKLDMAFGYLETLKASLARIPELLKTFRQSVLTQAVTGKLTETTFVNWSKMSLSDVIESKPKNGYSANAVGYETPFKVLTLTATTSGKFDPRFFKFFDETISADSHFWLMPNDILVQRGNAIDYVGVSAIYDGLPNEFIFPDLMIKVRANENLILTKFLYLSLSSKFSRNYLREHATGTTGNMPKINQPTLSSLPVTFPLIEEQKLIIVHVDALFAKADAIESQYLSLKEKIDKLPQALLAKAFRGELVPQNPADEPASVLLEKIQNEIGKLGKKGTKQMELVFED